MNKHIEDGGPAFPVPNDANVNGEKGMSTRVWLAGQALSGILAWPGDQSCGSAHTNASPDQVAEIALSYADAILAAVTAKPVPEDKPADDGWIPWNNGECPVPAETLTEVKFQCGEARVLKYPESWVWRGDQGGFNIVAYRVVKGGAK